MSKHNDPHLLIAFYSYSGVTRRVAEMLREKTSGILFEIQTVTEYPKKSVIHDAKKELELGRLPALKQEAPLLDSYDLVLVGGPVWWYTVATPVMAFLQQADFKGKRTAAFCTHEGGAGRYFADYEKQARNGEVLQGIELFSPFRSGKNIEATLDTWLSNLMR